MRPSQYYPRHLFLTRGLSLHCEVHPEERSGRVDLEETLQLLKHLVDLILRIDSETQDISARLGESLQH